MDHLTLTLAAIGLKVGLTVVAALVLPLAIWVVRRRAAGRQTESDRRILERDAGETRGNGKRR